MTEKIREKLNSPIMDTVIKAVVLMVLPWSIFVTNSIFEAKAFMHRGDRFSASDGHRLEKVILEESEKNRNLLFAFEREFSSQFVRKGELQQILNGLKK